MIKILVGFIGMVSFGLIAHGVGTLFYKIIEVYTSSVYNPEYNPPKFLMGAAVFLALLVIGAVSWIIGHEFFRWTYAIY
jgi:hypothetical protein